MSDLTAEVRTALAAATPGPWEINADDWIVAAVGPGVVVAAVCPDDCCLPDDIRSVRYDNPADASLIASAPSWLAALCDRLDTAEAKLAAAKAALSTHATEAHGCTCTECQIARILNGDPNA